MTKKTWNEKLETCKPHLVKRLDKNFAGMKAGQMMLVPSAKLLDQYVKTIETDDHVDIVLLRERLAKKYSTDVTCPVASGFAIKIVAEAAFEKLNQGIEPSLVTPIWRVLNEDSPTLQKVSFDKNIFLKLRQSELAAY